jgi:hypothetical protein
MERRRARSAAATRIDVCSEGGVDSLKLFGGDGCWNKSRRSFNGKAKGANSMMSSGSDHVA